MRHPAGHRARRDRPLRGDRHLPARTPESGRSDLRDARLLRRSSALQHGHRTRAVLGRDHGRHLPAVNGFRGRQRVRRHHQVREYAYNSTTAAGSTIAGCSSPSWRRCCRRRAPRACCPRASEPRTGRCRTAASPGRPPPATATRRRPGNHHPPDRSPRVRRGWGPMSTDLSCSPAGWVGGAPSPDDAVQDLRTGPSDAAGNVSRSERMWSACR